MAAKDDIPPVPLPPEGAAVPPPPPVEATPAAAAPPPVEAPPAAAAPAPPAPASADAMPGYQAAPPPTPPAAAPPAANPYAVPQPYSVAQPTAQPGYPQPGYAQTSYGQPVYGQPGYGQPAAPSGLAVASMILGIAGVVLSFFSVGFLPALAAVITGHLAVKRQPAAKPFWITGLITGYIGIAISVIYLIGIILFALVIQTYPGG